MRRRLRLRATDFRQLLQNAPDRQRGSGFLIRARRRACYQQRMWIKIFLAVIALLFLVFGIASFVDPIGMSASLEVEVGGANGAYEMRGIYGGVSLAAGLLCALGAFRARMQRPALWFLVTYMGGYVFARVAALALRRGDTAA
jgi:Domain of unknown function (DUF4345)